MLVMTSASGARAPAHRTIRILGAVAVSAAVALSVSSALAVRDAASMQARAAAAGRATTGYRDLAVALRGPAGSPSGVASMAAAGAARIRQAAR